MTKQHLDVHEQSDVHQKGATYVHSRRDPSCGCRLPISRLYQEVAVRGPPIPNERSDKCPYDDMCSGTNNHQGSLVCEVAVIARNELDCIRHSTGTVPGYHARRWVCKVLRGESGYRMASAVRPDVLVKRELTWFLRARTLLAWSSTAASVSCAEKPLLGNRSSIS